MKMNILALDLGKCSLGLAISRSGMFVSALPNLKFKEMDYDDCVKQLIEVTRFEKVEHIVLGLPLYPSGDECEMTPIVREFSKRLEVIFPNVDINYQDERESTLEAARMLHDVKKNAKKQKSIIDSAAAMIILERYLRSINQY